MSDSLFISDLELSTKIGVPDEERKTEQRVLVSVQMTTETAPVASSDDVSRGVDYFAVVQQIRALAATERKTIERLAEDVAATVLAQPAVQCVVITIEKFPISGIRSVSVEIERFQATR